MRRILFLAAIAAVALLGSPRYEERGYIITYMRVPVDPFHLRIQGNGITVSVLNK